MKHKHVGNAAEPEKQTPFLFLVRKPEKRRAHYVKALEKEPFAFLIPRGFARFVLNSYQTRDIAERSCHVQKIVANYGIAIVGTAG